MHRNRRRPQQRAVVALALLCLLLLPCLAGCGSTSEKKGVNPQFGLATLAMVGALKFDHGGDNSIVGDVSMRYEAPGRFEMIVTESPTVTICHLLADGDKWRLELPAQKVTREGKSTPSDEEHALWVETHRMVAMAIQKAQFQEDFTQTMHGEYKSGRLFQMEFSEFRKVVGQIFPMRMKLTCQGCKSSIEIALRKLK